MDEDGDTPVRYAAADRVALLTLSRPDRLNAWTPAMERAYYDALERASDDPAVRAVVLTGEGKGFCAGADMDMLSGLNNEERSATGNADGLGARSVAFPLMLGKPLIAAINGACAGVGFAQALMADVRFAAAGAKLTTSFARRGLVAEYGSSWLLPRIVGRSRALDLLLSGRVVLAEEALAMGLVDRVLPAGEVLPAAMAYARELVTWSSPASMAEMKRQVLVDADRPLDAAAKEATELMYRSFSGPDFAEGVTAWVERREPRFAPLGQGSRFD